MRTLVLLVFGLSLSGCTVYSKYGVRTANVIDGGALGVQLPDATLDACGLKADANQCMLSLPPNACPDGIAQVRWREAKGKKVVLEVWCLAGMLPPAPNPGNPGPGDL